VLFNCLQGLVKRDEINIENNCLLYYSSTNSSTKDEQDLAMRKHKEKLSLFMTFIK